MRIKKAELKAIIKEELANVLKEVSAEEQIGLSAADFARMPGSGIPSIEIAGKALAAINKIKNLERAEKRTDEESCVEWTNKQARKRGWNINKLSVHELIAYEKLLGYCRRRRSEKADLYKRRDTQAVQKAASAVRGSRSRRYLRSLGLGFIKEAVRREIRRMLSKDST